MEQNPSRPLPWHDTPTCRALKPGALGGNPVACGGPVVMDAELGVSPMCGACGTTFHPTPAERAQIRRAEEAWEGVLEGRYHETRACGRCGGVLPIECSRLCPTCAEADMRERNLSLF